MTKRLHEKTIEFNSTYQVGDSVDISLSNYELGRRTMFILKKNSDGTVVVGESMNSRKSHTIDIDDIVEKLL